MSDFAKDYIEVAERLAEFYELYPDGSLQGSWTWEQDGALIVYRAEAYRTPDDPRPGVGYAQEHVPGKTPYTRGSELMNAETSAWGRAMAALGIATKRGIATGHEVRMAKARQSVDLDQLAARISVADVDELRNLWTTHRKTPEWPQIEPLIAERKAQLDAAE